MVLAVALVEVAGEAAALVAATAALVVACYSACTTFPPNLIVDGLTRLYDTSTFAARVLASNSSNTKHAHALIAFSFQNEACVA